MGQVILKLRRVLNCVKTDVANQIDELLGPNTTRSYMDSELERLEQVSRRGIMSFVLSLVLCVLISVCTVASLIGCLEMFNII